MVIQFTFQDLILFLACTLGIVAGILLLPVLWKINKVVGILKPLIETNEEFINKTIRTMPGIFENVGQISSDVRETTDKLKGSVPMILQEVESVTSAAKGSFELASDVMGNMGAEINGTVVAYKKDTPGFMAYLHAIEEVLQIIYRTFSSGK